MCGYVGFTNNIKDADSILKEMMDTIKHRGPDGEDKYVDEDIALGHRRLSIIDLEQGSQPMYNEDNSKVLVFNGEIYNYKEVREDLKKQDIFLKPNQILKFYYMAMKSMALNF